MGRVKRDGKGEESKREQDRQRGSAGDRGWRLRVAGNFPSIGRNRRNIPPSGFTYIYLLGEKTWMFFWKP